MRYAIMLLFIMNALVSRAQSDGLSEGRLTKELNFDNETSEQEVTLQVNPSTRQLTFKFRGDIEQGKLIMTILDPNGKKEGGFELEGKDSSENANTATSTVTSSGVTQSTSSSSSSSKSGKTKSSSSNSNSNTNSNENNYSYSFSSATGGKANGQMNKSLENPVSGKWTIKIKYEKLKGKVYLMTSQTER
jgi:hypothetical protein